MKMSKIWKEKLQVGVVWIVALIIIWEFVAWLLKDVLHDAMYLQKFPYLHDIFRTFLQNAQPLLSAAGNTLLMASAGFLIGTAIGFCISILMSLTPFLEKMLFPYLILSQMIPVLALAPIVYSIVKDQNSSRIVLSAFITFFPVAVNMFSGLRSVQKDQVALMRTYGVGKLTLYRKLMIPAALPQLFTGMKLAAPAAVTAAILVEMLGANNGIGIKVLGALYYGANSALLFWASVILASLLGILGYVVLVVLERLLLPWAHEKNGKEG